MRGIALHGIHEVWDKVVAALQLHINIAPRLLGAIDERDKAIVGEDDPQREENDDGYDDEEWGHSG